MDSSKIKKVPGYKLFKEQIAFNNEKDEKLYESLFSKKVYITEEQAKYLKKHIISEDYHMISDIVGSFQNKDKYIKNDFDGEKWERIPEESDFFKELKEKMTFENKSRLSLYGLAKVKNENHYIGVIFGGLNGNGKWEDYLKDINTALSKVYNGYVIDLDNDACDDVWTLVFGFKENKNLNEGASGYQPEDSDAYFDTCYTISKKLFSNIIKSLEDNIKEKNDNIIFTYLGILNHFLQVKELLGPIYYTNKDIETQNKERLAVKIIETAIKSYNYLFSDKEENRQGWKDFNSYKFELKRQYDIFKNTMKLLNDDCEIEIIKPYHLHESTNYVEPKKVLIVKKYLDDNFVRAAIPTIGNDGYPKTLLIVGMKGTDGNVIRNMYSQQLFDLLQDKFSKIYADKEKRDKFLKRVMKDWYDKKITKDGLMGVNIF